MVLKERGWLARLLTFCRKHPGLAQNGFRECGLHRFCGFPKRAQVILFTFQKCRLRNQYCIGKPDEHP